MTRIYLLVEGQTEEAFVNQVLKPYYGVQNIYLFPIIVRTSPGYKGGVISYAKVKPQIDRLCKQDKKAYVSTLFDLYGLPQDFPGKNNVAYSHDANGKVKAELIENEWARDVAHSNFIPNLLVHEYEALLFTKIEAFEQWTDDDSVLAPLYEVRKTSAPEEINDSTETAPSKRILKVMPWYKKTFHGPLIAGDIGLDALRQECPHFSAWLERLENLSIE